jgi:citrate lyase beta subunit
MQQTYQFFDFTSKEYLQERINKINANGAVAVFDLEDAFFIPFNKSLTAELKSSARKILYSFLNSMKNENTKIGIRINNYSDKEYDNDISLLKSIGPIDWECIFLPKTESVYFTEETITGLTKNNIKYKELIPIIESKRALENIEELCYCFRLKNINKLAYGHCDFNFDSEIFPFLSLDNKETTEIIKKIDQTALKYSIEYVNTPYLNLKDTSGFKNFALNIYFITGRKFSQVTLCKNQTETFNAISFEKINVKNSSDVPLDSYEYAKKIIRYCESNRHSNKGFAISDNYEVLSPHEYIIAKKFLGEK